MERRKFPGVVEMISGKFLRHSPEFYAWRIKDRTEKLKTDPSRLDWYDDLAVAYSKTGNQKKAIEIIEQKDKLQPGLYETEANWGTFLLFDGQWEEALKHVNKALEINPNAHFGREKYQALLIEYVIPRLKDGKPQFPLADVEVSVTYPLSDPKGLKPFRSHESFFYFLSRTQRGVVDVPEAVKALLGMMHFADFRSPIVLEPLGSLLSEDQAQAQRMASRAFLRSAEAVSDERTKSAYRKMAENILHLQVGVDIEKIETPLRLEVDEADQWYAELRDAELSWIRDGKDPEAEFERQYPVEPEVTITAESLVPDAVIPKAHRANVALVIAAGSIVALVLFAIWFARRRRARA
jgi:tetratricopeptide (TPR) repeat protein